MGLFDTIVGGSSSPVFLSYQRRNRLDVTPLLKYGDYRSKLAQQTLGTRPDVKPTDIKEGIAYTDVRMIEQMQQKGMKELEGIFKQSGYDYAYAVTTPEYQKAMSKINIPISDILRLKQEKEELDAFNKIITEKEGQDLVFTGGEGLSGATYDPSKKKWISNSDASLLRQTDPNWAYQIHPEIKMTSTLKRGEDVNTELDKLFNQAGISKKGGSWQSVGAKPWGDTVAVMLNTMHSTESSNIVALNDAINFFTGYLSEDDKVGMFNEYIKSNTYRSKFQSKETAGTLDRKEVFQDFASNYIPDYIKRRASGFFKTERDLTMVSEFLEKDVKKAEEEKAKISTWDAYWQGSQFVYSDPNAVHNVSFGTKKDAEGKEYEDVKALSIPKGRMHEEDIPVLNKDVTSIVNEKIVYNKPANQFGPTAIGPNGMMVNLDDLTAKGQWKIMNVPGDIMYGVAPEKDVTGKYTGLKEEYFFDTGKKNDKGQPIFAPDFKKIDSTTGKPLLKPQPFIKVTITTSENDADDDMQLIRQGDDGKFRKEDAIRFGSDNPKDEFESTGALRENDAEMYEMDIWVPLSSIMQYDQGIKKETNIKVEQLLTEQQKNLVNANKAYQLSK